MNFKYIQYFGKEFFFVYALFSEVVSPNVVQKLLSDMAEKANDVWDDGTAGDFKWNFIGNHETTGEFLQVGMVSENEDGPKLTSVLAGTKQVRFIMVDGQMILFTRQLIQKMAINYLILLQ